MTARERLAEIRQAHDRSRALGFSLGGTNYEFLLLIAEKAADPKNIHTILRSWLWEEGPSKEDEWFRTATALSANLLGEDQDG